MRIAWLCHYFAPEIGAPQARLLEMSRAWVAAGHSVTAVTCFANHPTGELAEADRGLWQRRDELDGIAVHRCWSYATPNRGFLKKIVGHLSFMVTGWFGLSRAAQAEGRPDIVIVSSPTFFSVITAWAWCAWRGVPYVFEVRDLWPAVFVELGVLKNRAAIAVLEWIELFLYRRARRVVAVTRSFADAIAERGIARGKLGVVTNGVDAELFRPGPRDDELAASLGLDGKFVVLYLGAHGISHSLEKLLPAAEALRDLPDVHFLFVGEGARKEALVAAAEAAALPNVSFHGGVPKSEVPRFYSLASVGLVPLRDVALFHTFIPSKMFELLAAGIPVVGSVAGEAAEILQESGGAMVVAPEDGEAVADCIRRLHGQAELRERMASVGRDFVVANYTRSALAAHYSELLERALSSQPEAGR